MSQVSIAQIKPGEAFLFKNQPFMATQIRSKHMGRGGAIYRVRMRNLKTGTILNNAFRPTDKFELIETEWQSASFLYRDRQNAYFMDLSGFTPLSLSLKIIGDSVKFLKEGEIYKLEVVNGEPAGLRLPKKISRQVIEAPEAVAGNTVTEATKWVVIEGGIKIETPLFIETGDIIIINVDKGTYVSRG